MLSTEQQKGIWPAKNAAIPTGSPVETCYITWSTQNSRLLEQKLKVAGAAGAAAAAEQ